MCPSKLPYIQRSDAGRPLNQGSVSFVRVFLSVEERDVLCLHALAYVHGVNRKSASDRTGVQSFYLVDIHEEFECSNIGEDAIGKVVATRLYENLVFVIGTLPVFEVSAPEMLSNPCACSLTFR